MNEKVPLQNLNMNESGENLNSNRNCDPQSLVQTDEKSLLQDFEISVDGMSPCPSPREVTEMILDTNEQSVV